MAAGIEHGGAGGGGQRVGGGDHTLGRVDGRAALMGGHVDNPFGWRGCRRGAAAECGRRDTSMPWTGAARHACSCTRSRSSAAPPTDRKSVVYVNSVSVLVDSGVPRNFHKNRHPPLIAYSI